MRKGLSTRSLWNTSMVRSIEIKKASVRDRLIIDVDVFMNEPKDFDFSPRASMEGNSLSITNAG
ncbi:MAG TPA: hypothetical protein D7I15_06980, partial [Candidatus Poseidoniales archaeon]